MPRNVDPLNMCHLCTMNDINNNGCISLTQNTLTFKIGFRAFLFPTKKRTKPSFLLWELRHTTVWGFPKNDYEGYGGSSCILHERGKESAKITRLYLTLFSHTKLVAHAYFTDPTER